MVRISGRGAGGAGHVATAPAAAVTDVARQAVLVIDVLAAWIVHELAVVAGAEVAGLAWVVVAVVDAAVVAVAVVARWVAFDVVGVVVVVARDLHLWLHYRVGIVVSYA